MKCRSRIMEEADVHRALARIAHEIIERNGQVKELYLLGVMRRGAPLCKMIAEKIETFSDLKVHCGTVDITCYRDDLPTKAQAPNPPELPFTVEGKTVILVDDVIYTGRSARAALEAVLAHGRPERIQLAVLIDRGHRELPIRGDYVGKNVPTSKSEQIEVHIPPFDETVDVELYGN